MKFLRSLVVLGVLAGMVLVGAAWYVGGQRPTGASASAPRPGLDVSLANGGTHTLSSGDVESLRSDGWTCPDLSTAGYWLESTQLTERGGEPAVVAELRSTAHAVTLVEQHPGPQGRGAAPVDGVTGRPVTAEAYSRTTRDGMDIWVARSSSRTASTVVFRVADSVYSLRSDTSAADAVKVASVIAAADRAQVDRSAPADGGVVARVTRGLNRLLGQP